MRLDRDQANCCTIVADHNRIPQRHMIPSQVGSLAVYQINFLLSPHRYLQQTKQSAGRLSSQLPLQTSPFCSLRRCWQIMLGRPRHSLVWTSALSDTVVLTPTIMKGLSTPVQPQHLSREIMKSNQQAHDQRAADYHQGIALDADPTTKMNSMVLPIFFHHQLLRRSIKGPQTCRICRSI